MLKSYRRLLNFLRPYWLYILGALVSTFIITGVIVFVPTLVQKLIDDILPKKNLLRLNLFVLLGAGLALLLGFFIYTQKYLAAFAGGGAVKDLRDKVFAHLQKLSFTFYVKWKTGELISRTINDIGILERAMVKNLIDALLQILVLTGLTVRIFLFNWHLALSTLIVVPLVGLAMVKFGHQIRRATLRMQAKLAHLSHILQEKITGVREVKSFSREDYEIENFVKENEKNFHLSLKYAQIRATQDPVIQFLAILGILAVVWISLYLHFKGALTKGELAAFFVTVFLIIDPLKILSGAYGDWQQAVGASERIFEILDTHSEVKEKKDALSLPPLSGEVDFRGVSFEYDNGPQALKNVSLKFKPGEVIALVGPSGAGKSTFLNLIPRFYDPTSGSIEIDGHDLRDLKLKSLREQMGIVPQETILFSGTIHSNISYGKLDASEEEIVSAAKAANAHSFILNLPQGYDSEVGERGVKLSGGEKQRIAMARVILKNPRVILLDEATSALDTESENLIQEAMKHLMAGKTTFIIAHRLSTVRNADRIIVFDRGEIVEQGSHKELIEKKGLYAKLYKAQFKGQSALGRQEN